MENNNNNKNYNFGGLRKVDNMSIGYINGVMTQGKDKPLVESRMVTVKGEQKKVVSFSFSTKQAKSKMKRNFGDAFEKEEHFIKVSVWGQVADRFEKAIKGQKCILGLFGAIKAVPRDYNGKTYNNLEMTVDDFQIIKRLGEASEATTGANDGLEPVESGDMPF